MRYHLLNDTTTEADNPLMGVDYSVEFDCQPKRHFGNGDYAAGGADILERVKSRSRAVHVRQFAVENGLNPAETKVKLNYPDAHRNPVEKEVTVAELEQHASALDARATACFDCPMNLFAREYGCLGWINYPIRQSEEEWLIGKLQPFGTIGADLCLNFITEFRISGERIKGMRQSGFLELQCGREIVLKKSLFKKHSVHTDQLLEMVLLGGECLQPAHCLGVLLWFGAMHVEGIVPGALEDRATLQRLLALKTLTERSEHTGFVFDDEVVPRGSFAMLLRAMYVAWMHDQPLSMSS